MKIHPRMQVQLIGVRRWTDAQILLCFRIITNE